jgi:UDP-N-acetylmuramoylalanine--D-glutamate ligase
MASALFLTDRGARVSVSEARSADDLRDVIVTLRRRGVAVETDGHTEAMFRNQDLIVVSPGVPHDLPQLEVARKAAIPIIGEIELASRFTDVSIVAITGSNGKTTTTSLVGEILAKSGLKTLVGGNIGIPALSLLPQGSPESYMVLEISSFQLETIEHFRPRIAVILNITPDHLDRHRSFEAYAAAKARIFENQSSDDFVVLNADDPTCASLARYARSHVCWFSRKVKPQFGAFTTDERIYFNSEKQVRELMPVSELSLKGGHNLENVLAGVSVAMLAGCAPERIRAAVREFKAVEHRLEFVARLGGVEFYNDSKATNVDATIKALESFPANIHLILGGKDKDSDYSVLNKLLAERVKRVYTIGAAAEKIESQVAGVPIQRAVTLDVAVRSAATSAKPGDIVLLAPACASFDQFQNYEHRGRMFKELVHKLSKGTTVPANP